MDGPLADLEDLRLEAAGEYVAYAPGVLPRFAPGITEDWSELFGFQEPVASLDGWVAARWSRGKAEHVAATAVVCFLNVDNAYWEIHSSLPEMIEAVRSDMEAESFRDVTPTSLRESFGL